MNAKEEIKNLKRSIELQFGLKRNGDADALAMMNWYKRLSQIEAAIFDLPSDEDIQERALKYSTGCYIDYVSGCNFILNYKKSEL